MTNSPNSTFFPQIRGSQSEAAATNGRARSTRSSGPIVDKACDEVLIGLLQGGGQEAIGSLFRRYARTVHSVGRRILHDAAEAEDLVQEVFLYVLRKSNLYDPSKGSARSWLVQIAYTQAFLKRRKLKSIGLVGSDIVAHSREAEPFIDLPAEYETSLEGLFGRSGWLKVQEALTEDQRETLRLFFFEGYTFAEIAEKLGQSFSNVRHHYYRGLEKLRKNLANNVLNRR
jgi:RNA polymerase sigma-70 factor (ECF subfamily)